MCLSNLFGLVDCTLNLLLFESLINYFHEHVNNLKLRRKKQHRLDIGFSSNPDDKVISNTNPHLHYPSIDPNASAWEEKTLTRELRPFRKFGIKDLCLQEVVFIWSRKDKAFGTKQAFLCDSKNKESM